MGEGRVGTAVGIAVVEGFTGGVGEPEGDGLVWDAAHIADRHLACVAGIVLGPQVLQL